MRKNAKHYQTLKNFSTLVSLTWHFTKFIFLEQLITKLQFNMQNMLLFFLCFFFSFFEAVIMIRNLYFICIIFVKDIFIYWLILTVKHQRPYFPFRFFFFFFFFYLYPVDQTFLYPSKFCNHLKHSAK